MSLAPRRLFRLSLAPLALLPSLAGAAAAPAAPAPAHAVDPTYAAVRAARLDGRAVDVAGLVLARDAFRFQLDSGTFYLLAPVDGHTLGAVFRGHGSYRLVPSREEERRHLALETGEGEKFEVLSDTFEDLVLWFGDDTAGEIGRAGTVKTAVPNAPAQASLERATRRVRKDLGVNVPRRLLGDLLNPAGAGGVFVAYVDGKRYPPALAAVDPRGAEALGMSEAGGGETILQVIDEKKGGTWYLSHLRGEEEARTRHPPALLAEATDYVVDSRVTTSAADNPELAGTTTIQFVSRVPGLRVLPIDLLPRLRIESARVSPVDHEDWKEATFIQEDKDADADAAIVLPEPLAKGATANLRLVYRGTGVLHNAGEGNYVVGARSSWYPNFGAFGTPATYELHYRIPKGNDLVSVGNLLSSKVESNEAVSTWATDLPIRVAGFNFGKFKKLTQKDPKSGFEVDVYTGATTPDVVYQIDQFLGSQASVGGGGYDPDEGGGGAGGAPAAEGHLLKTDKLTTLVFAQALFAERVFAAYFGPLPDHRIAITQQSEWNYGQSWPGLVFLPYMAFLPSIQRAELGLSQASDFIDDVCFHELSHQWWGHLVGWGSYRDQWLSEGFAEFSAGLAVQFSGGQAEYDRFWRNGRKKIFDRHMNDAVPPNDAGAVDEGWRASTHRSPSGFEVMYTKGAYVLEMLRSMMYASGTSDPDARFIAMMKDFTSTYTRKSPTTDDFQKVVERHMTPAMDVAGNQKMDWFFDQWVRGTEIPRYRSELAVKKEGDKYRIMGKVMQQGVSERFFAMVPLDLEFAKGKTVRLAMLRMTGSVTTPVDVAIALPQEPKRAIANLHGEVLARD